MSLNLFKYLFRKKPCFRCGGNATVQFMNLDYCVICRKLVMTMLPSVGMGGMFGFPGASGYLEHPKLGKILEKKEI